MAAILTPVEQTARPSHIAFNEPNISGQEGYHLAAAIQSRKLSGDGPFTKRCQQFFEQCYGFPKVLLTTSCTDALEMSAILANIQPGDEVIVPAYTFVSSANAFALRGAKLMFADSLPDNPNIDPGQIAALISPRTKAIVVVHYAGVVCDMDRIGEIAAQAGIVLVEDAAQAVDSTYRGRPAGSFGTFAAFSFHETKNITCGEGGMIVVNSAEHQHRAEIIREKGTNRSAFIRGEIDRYGWVDVGSSFLPSELNAAFLWAQLETLKDVEARRRAIFARYMTLLSQPMAAQGVAVPDVPPECGGNGHAFYLVCRDDAQRSRLIESLREQDIQSATHYAGLHRSQFFFSQHDGRVLPHSDRFTNGLLRLPLHANLTDADVDRVAEAVVACA